MCFFVVFNAINTKQANQLHLKAILKTANQHSATPVQSSYSSFIFPDNIRSVVVTPDKGCDLPTGLVSTNSLKDRLLSSCVTTLDSNTKNTVVEMNDERGDFNVFTHNVNIAFPVKGHS